MRHITKENGTIIYSRATQSGDEQILEKGGQASGVDKNITFHCARHIELPLSLNLNRLQRLVS